MERNDFILEQYRSLREEIRETKDRIFKIAGIGLFVAPAGHYLARALDTPLLHMFLPLLVISVALLYLAENPALMRCGRYIRLHIESEIPNITGWEEWLETRDACQPRSVDRLVSYSMYLLLGAYYVGSVLAAWRLAVEAYGVPPSAILVGLYGGLGVVFVFFLSRSVRATTTTSIDLPWEKNRTPSAGDERSPRVSGEGGSGR